MLSRPYFQQTENSNGPKKLKASPKDNKEEREPDWVAICGHEPASRDVPIFLAARERRQASEERFRVALDECHSTLKQYVTDILQTAADIYSMENDRLEELERQLQLDFVNNESARSAMEQRLQESARAAEGLFAKLLMKVSNPFRTVSGLLQQQKEQI